MATISKLDQRFGQIVVQDGVLSQEEIDQAVIERVKRGFAARPIGKYLVENGYISEKDCLNVLGRQFNLAVMDLEGINVQPELVEKVSEKVCRRYRLVPLFTLGEEVTVAISDPTRIDGLDLVASIMKAPVQPVLASETQINQLLEQAKNPESGQSEEAEDAIVLSDLDLDYGNRDATIESLRKAGEEAPIVKIVDKIMKLAVRDGASDIHIEPGENNLMVRFRVDGIMRKEFSFATRLSAAIISRVKILSNLDISERQKPQDGRIQMKLADRELEFRVSILPVYYGEKAVLRILDRGSVRVSLENLGFSKKNLDIFQSLIKQPNGMVLVTGPTGSGKSTTLYAALNAINSIEKNIVTVEDPVEYQIPLINQVGVNPRRGLTFAGALRSMLRQDPDIIMVGEVRDQETGAIAAEAALTGHLVLTTLHTNDAPSSITRLIEMGVPPFLIAPTLLGICAQRLIRRVCPQCKAPYEPGRAEIEEAGVGAVIGKVVFYKGKGCGYCGGSGYRGRVGIHEVMKIDEELRELITEKVPTTIIRKTAIAKGFTDLRFDGLKKAAAGLTTLEEVIRVTKMVE